MSEFGLCRVGSLSTSVVDLLFLTETPQFQFRLKALNNEIPGVKKASW